jgi:hypothetical protein
VGNNKNKTNPANTMDKTKEDLLRIFNSKNKVSKVNTNNSQDVKPINEINKKWAMNDKIIDIFVKNIDEDQELRKKYATILIMILAIELVALILIFVLKGLDILHYSDTTFNIFITGGIAEVFILVRIIVKYLFKDNLTNALNIILENNNPSKRYVGNNHNNKNKAKSNENEKE